tara:strand:+ start:105 stop:263 length:159 start_codon:yes stop_codon:yes gene_type:complete
MSIKQASSTELVIFTKLSDVKSGKRYIKIDSEEGQKLIKDHNLVIKQEIEEL